MTCFKKYDINNSLSSNHEQEKVLKFMRAFYDLIINCKKENYESFINEYNKFKINSLSDSYQFYCFLFDKLEEFINYKKIAPQDAFNYISIFLFHITNAKPFKNSTQCYSIELEIKNSFEESMSFYLNKKIILSTPKILVIKLNLFNSNTDQNNNLLQTKQIKSFEIKKNFFIGEVEYELKSIEFHLGRSLTDGLYFCEYIVILSK